MSEFMIQETTLKGIADAIREKNKTTDEIAVADMPAKIKENPFGMLDTSQITDWSNFCAGGRRLALLPLLDTSNGTDFSSLFSNSTGLTEVANFDTSKAETLAYCFNECPKLQNAPVLNTPVCEGFNHMYYKCSALVNGGTYDMRSVPKKSAALYAQYMFAACELMTNVTIKTDKLYSSNMVRMFYQCSNLTDLTIEGTIKVDDNNMNVAYSPKLTVESLLSVLNALEDNTGESTQYTVYLGSTNLAKLTTEQKNIAYNKNLKLG